MRAGTTISGNKAGFYGEHTLKLSVEMMVGAFKLCGERVSDRLQHLGKKKKKEGKNKNTASGNPSPCPLIPI